MKRRTLIKAAALTAFASKGATGREDRRTPPLVGVQIAPHSLLDEGLERCLDVLQEKAAVNTLFIYSQTYHAGNATPANVLANDHGIPVRTPASRKLPHLWVRMPESSFRKGLVRHPAPSPEREYHGRDLFRELREPATARGMKVYARILEADARREQRIPGYRDVLTVDHEGKRGHGPCWNHPAYREWIYSTIRELVTRYELDGLQYGAERTGPLSHVLYRGMTPTCFCNHCVDRNRARGIDPSRAREGFAKLYQWIKSVEPGSKTSRPPETDPADGVLSGVLRLFYRYPQILSWDYEWFQSDEEICSEIHRIAKRIRPNIDSGRHVDHQRSSWDFFYRSAISYSQMAENADFIKPITYHDSMGPRLRWWVLERLKNGLLKDLSLKQSLELYYALFDHNASVQPSVDELDSNGLGPEYVFQETRRCKQAVGDAAKVYAGIGIDVPWYIPGGMEPRLSDPEVLIEAVRRAIDAGADGVLASREYEEMRMSSLEAFGRAVRERG